MPKNEESVFPGTGERIKQRLKALGYWKRERPDVKRFCEENGYLSQYVYAWLKDRVPSYRNLKRVADDLKVPMEWVMFGTGLDAGGTSFAEDGAVTRKPESSGIRRAAGHSLTVRRRRRSTSRK